jgi:antitoxin (DNA-binding transcriptional repressor) of toxin-antitoxin stability system
MLLVPTAKAKGILSEMIKKATAGETVFIERYGKPVVAIVPVDKAVYSKRIGALAGKLEVPENFDEKQGS